MSNRPKNTKRIAIYYRDFDGKIEKSNERLPNDKYHYNIVHTCIKQGGHIFNTKHIGSKSINKLYNCIKHITKGSNTFNNIFTSLFR